MNIICLLILLVVFLSGCNSAEKKNQAWPGLFVSDNKRYLITQEGEPFLWMGETSWGMAEWLSREEVDYFLDDRKEKGFNLVQICLFWGKREDDPLKFTINPPNAYGFKAFKEAEGIPDPVNPAVITGGSPKSPNDFWDHAEYIVQAAAKRKMIIALLPVWGRRYVNGTHENFSEKLFIVSTMNTYGRFLGKRFQAYTNIIWVLGGDVAADRGGDFLGHYRAMAEGIIAGITGREVKWDEESLLWDYALMTYHPDGSPFLNSSEWFHNDPWLDFNMIETFTNRDMVYAAVSNDYKLNNPVKPTVMAEPGYEGYFPGSREGNSSDIQMRRQAFHSFFAGAAGFTYGAARDSSGNGPLFSPFKGWEKTLDMKGAGSMKFVQEFCLGHNWPHWKPVNKVVQSDLIKSEYQKVAVVTENNDECLICFPDNSSAKLDLSEYFNDAEAVSVQWYNPASGSYSGKTQMELSEGIIEVTPPAECSDAILVLSGFKKK
jgi:hypothetical protein